MIGTDIIKELSLFNDFTESELKEASKACEYRIYEPGDVIMKEGEPGGILYIIRKGGIKITRNFHNQEEMVLAILRENDFFGELSLLDGRARSASAIAINHAELIALSKEEFDHLAEINPSCGYKIMRRITLVVGSLLRDMNEKFIGMINYMWR